MSVKTHNEIDHSPANQSQALTLVDTHVHIHDCFDINELLTGAWHNFRQQASESNSENTFTGVLLLTETAQADWFHSILSRIKAQPDQPLTENGWTFEPTSEPCSLTARTAEGKQVVIVAGRQIITEEKMEVLSLISGCAIADGQPIETVIQKVQANGGIPVLPWGFGKWIGPRGKVIARLLKGDRPTFFLGDNSGRPTFWGRPNHFQTIEQKGRQVLPGTDPLFIATEASRPGSFGLALTKPLDASTPGASLKAQLLNPDTHWEPYGKLETPLGFLKNQLAIRINKPKKNSQMKPQSASI